MNISKEKPFCHPKVLFLQTRYLPSDLSLWVTDHVDGVYTDNIIEIRKDEESLDRFNEFFKKNKINEKDFDVIFVQYG